LSFSSSLRCWAPTKKVFWLFKNLGVGSLLGNLAFLDEIYDVPTWLCQFSIALPAAFTFQIRLS
jgi:hypothetical protein